MKRFLIAALALLAGSFAAFGVGLAQKMERSIFVDKNPDALHGQACLMGDQREIHGSLAVLIHRTLRDAVASLENEECARERRAFEKIMKPFHGSMRFFVRQPINALPAEILHKIRNNLQDNVPLWIIFAP